MAVAMVLAALGLAGAVALYLLSSDESNLRDFGRTVNGLHQDYFDGFWGCVFQGTAYEEVRSNADLEREIGTRARRGGERFGRMVRRECFAKLADLEARLTALIPPASLETDVHQMRDQTRELRAAFEGYTAAVINEDESQTVESMASIARAWYEYRRAYRGLNDGLRRLLGGGEGQ